VHGLNLLTSGETTPERLDSALERARAGGFRGA
jgi:hypothetical protein